MQVDIYVKYDSAARIYGVQSHPTSMVKLFVQASLALNKAYRLSNDNYRWNNNNYCLQDPRRTCCKKKRQKLAKKKERSWLKKAEIGQSKQESKFTSETQANVSRSVFGAESQVKITQFMILIMTLTCAPLKLMFLAHSPVAD